MVRTEIYYQFNSFDNLWNMLLELWVDLELQQRYIPENPLYFEHCSTYKRYVCVYMFVSFYDLVWAFVDL